MKFSASHHSICGSSAPMTTAISPLPKASYIPRTTLTFSCDTFASSSFNIQQRGAQLYRKGFAAATPRTRFELTSAPYPSHKKSINDKGDRQSVNESERDVHAEPQRGTLFGSEEVVIRPEVFQRPEPPT